jgi:peptidoglycan DL-endopeptidase CwlO
VPLVRPLALAPGALAAAFCLLAVAAAPAPAADLSSRLEAKEARLEEMQQRKGVLTTTIAGYKGRIDRLADEVATIRTEQAATRVRLALAQQRVTTADEELEAAHDRLGRLRSHLRVALGALRERLVAIYETGSPELLDVLIGEGDLEDVEARTEYVDRIHDMDEAVAGRVRDLRDRMALMVERRAAAKGEIEAARNRVATEDEELIATASALRGRQGDLVAARGEREAALARVGEHEVELDGDVESIQAKIAEALIASSASALPPGGLGSGTMIWPVDGPIASGFGPRTIEGHYEYHPGIDIAVPEGTPIRAALTGTVAFTESEAGSGGYGNYTCIDHGGGLSTCYAHQSAFAVSAGDRVQQGEVIGYSGCTGYCLGPHVHFEVRINGEVTDPLGYL